VKAGFFPSNWLTCVASDEKELSGAFQRMLNKRNYPDYFMVIKEPVAFSTIRVCFPTFSILFDLAA
jgi:hypothetical protein